MLISFPNSKIIAFEGMDNCFKETNAKIFAKCLSNEYPFGHVNFQSFPRYNEYSSLMIKKYLNGEFNRSLLKHDPEVIKSFFMNDRLAYWNEFNKYTKMTNKETYLNKSTYSCFVFDRYNISNVVYNNEIITIDNFKEEEPYGIPSADIVVWLMYKDFDLYIDELQKKKNKDMNENDKELLYHIWNMMRRKDIRKTMEEANITPIFIYCDDSEGNIKPKEKIASEIWRKTIAALNKIMKKELY